MSKIITFHFLRWKQISYRLCNVLIYLYHQLGQIKCYSKACTYLRGKYRQNTKNTIKCTNKRTTSIKFIAEHFLSLEFLNGFELVVNSRSV